MIFSPPAPQCRLLKRGLAWEVLATRTRSEVAIEGPVQLRPNRDRACRATATFQESVRQGDAIANALVVEHVPDGQRKDFGNPKAEKQLETDERTVARVQFADAADEESFPGGCETTGAGHKKRRLVVRHPADGSRERGDALQLLLSR